MARRLNFLWYILHEDDESLIRRFFKAQQEHPMKSDWVSTVQNDLKELEIEMNFEEVGKISKLEFKEKVKAQVTSKALEYLKQIQMTKSKSSNLKYV